MMKMRRDWDNKEKEWIRREKEWVLEDQRGKEKLEKRVKALEVKVKELEEEKRMDQKRQEKERSVERESWGDWSSWWSWGASGKESSPGDESEKEGRIKSKIQRVERKKTEPEDITRKYKSKVIILKRGPRWRKEKSIEDWLKEKTGMEFMVGQIKDSRDIAKIWWTIQKQNRRYGTREKSGKKGFARLEEWKKVKERKASYKALDDMRRVDEKGEVLTAQG